MWTRCYLKANGGAKILEKFGEVHRKIIFWGTTKLINIDKSLDEKRAVENKLCIVLLPEGRFKKIWNIVVLLLLMYTAIYVPFQTSFIDTDSSFMSDIELVIDALFISDVLINFISAYENESTGFLEIHVVKIAVNYLKSWFLLDILCSIPF